MTLSQNRAQSAVDWIVKYGNIDKRRIIARGYGETLLTNECADDVECNEDQHQANRRTEITILRQ
jgi:outer membrane protein OmpA-like peptidoglycan-associated protein